MDAPIRQRVALEELYEPGHQPLGKCCLASDEQAARAGQDAAHAAHAHGVHGWEDELDRTSNLVIDLIAADRLDEAEALCRRLAAEWPDEIDGIERLALVRRAQGRHGEAAALFRQAAEFARVNPGFDADAVYGLVKDAEEQDALAARQ